MNVTALDWGIIAAFFIISLGIGLFTAKSAGSSAKEFFLSGRNMPWWLLGVSMVATTFSADTPNLVTDIVRKNGVAGNWAWWAFLLTGMLTVFVYAKLWRRSEATTDLEFYEMRYSGRGAAFLRGFRALYLGVFFNVVIMATVSLAAIKIGGVMLGLSPIQTLLIASIVTVVYSSLGGLKGVLLTDFFQFFIAIAGSFGAAYYILDLPQIGSLSNLLAHDVVSTKLNFLPDFSDPNMYIPLFLMPIAIQWWATWYPGAEPGGGGYIAQRMLSAKDEKNAIGATLFFNIAHYALRPWPWILIALSSLVIFPNISDLQAAFPNIPVDKLGDDLAYSAMLTYLPTGLIGIVLASLIAAVMSTLSTHLNWGSSYVVNDFYLRFVKPEATDKQLVAVGRISTVGLMVLSAILALALSSALDAFNILLQIGAGTGLIFILRWFWWRINAYTEISAMAISFVVAIFFEVINPKVGWIMIPENQAYLKLLYSVSITTVGWLLVTFLTQPEKDEILLSFYRKVTPAAYGWKKVLDRYPAEKQEQGQLPKEIGLMVTGTVMVYAALFSTGFFIYGNLLPGFIAAGIAILGGVIIISAWKKLN
ncbi:sodium:solute symporter family protein [Algoriphagus sp.]|jgi:Na+/proline symporter|uniref:sodium:solute symporter family protein n=1 Tax=Algoriphagus sp. TaxID=1872435 RepID=UPI0027242D89|nr:sodium:solute symporter family protein [Algoriphagus sp.]MDO8965583.1 sodium:solute symporter family protein [Algoriphagus sp.]MDP3201623.1 sodium:solute symporter family protein [Algoriphagus sp.]